MVRWTRDRLPIVVGLVLVGGVGVGTVWAFHLDLAPRADALALLGIGLGLVGVLPLLVQLGRGRRSADSRPVEVLATLLAQAVYGQWRKTADERRLMTPAPIPIRWALSDLDVTGPVAAAVGAPDQPPAFPPLPGHTTITGEELRAGGGRRELHRLFAGLTSGRIVVVGAPGAGKSGTAILLLLDALAHRDSLNDTDRARVPVPVLFTGHGWNPNTTSVQDWLCDRLVATRPLFGRRGDDADAAAMVAARDKVALILDGLDEMDEALRPATLEALSDAPFRVVVFTRSPEMIQAAREAWLVGAVAVHLQEVIGPEAAEYLQRALPGPPPSGWTQLLSQVREHPNGVLARAMATPLALTLIRDTYQASDDVGELLDVTRYPTPEAIRQRLIARVLPAAYTRRPGRPSPRYSEEQARQALTFIARRMSKDRDLAWWRIPDWAPGTPRFLITGPMVGLVIGLEAWLLVGLVPGLAGLMGGLLYGHRAAEPEPVRIANWRAAISRQVLGEGLMGLMGLVLLLGFVLVGGLVFGLPSGNPSEFIFIFVFVGVLVVFTLVGAVVVEFMCVLLEGHVGEGNSLGPREIWRNNRMVGLVVGLVVGLPLGLMAWLMDGLKFGLASGLTSGFVYGLVSGFVFALTHPTIWPTTLAWLQLRRSGHVPAVSLMPFLEDARERGVLRTVGGVYQFRHATLQDQLADRTTPDSAVWRVP